MGRYIQGPARKAEGLRERGAKEIQQPKTFAEIPEGMALLALKNNGPFDAVAWVFDEAEFKEFTDPTDPRPSSYWLMDLEEVKTMTGYDS